MTLLIILMSFLLGGIPTGLILGKLITGKDIRAAGSGNIGTTNAFRTLGKGIGALTFVGDCLKGFLAVRLTMWLSGADLLPVALAMFFVVLGHCYTPLLGFSGGKGVATVCGVGFAVDWRLTIGLLVIFAAVTILSRMVSLGSITAQSVGILTMLVRDDPLLIRLAFVAFFLVSIGRHRENIIRIKNGTENRFGRGHA